MMPPGSGASLTDGFFLTSSDGWSSLLVLFAMGPAHAVAGKLDPMSGVNEAVEDGVGVGGIAEHFMMPPFRKG
jgi:hypothetical protein